MKHMKHISLIALGALALSAQTGLLEKAAPAKTPFDKVRIEAYVKSLEGWQDNPQLKIAISDPKPSVYLEGFDEFNVVLVFQGEEVIQRNYFWRDGKIVQGMVSDTAKHPFQSNIDKLKSEMSPSFGTPPT